MYAHFGPSLSIFPDDDGTVRTVCTASTACTVCTLSTVHYVQYAQYVLVPRTKFGAKYYLMKGVPAKQKTNEEKHNLESPHTQKILDW